MAIVPPIPPNAPTPTALHERSSASARETRQAVLTMSTAILGFFIVAITSKDAPQLPIGQKWLLGATLGAMAATATAALWFAWSDARWAYCWAKQLSGQPPGKAYWTGWRSFWHGQKRWSEILSLILFAAGVIGAAVYMIGSSRLLVGSFHSLGSMQVRIFSRKYSSSRKP
jgi:hypothetical protein